MACRGVHFAITDAQREHLLALKSDSERIDYLQLVIEKEAMGSGHELESVQKTSNAGRAEHLCGRRRS